MAEQPEHTDTTGETPILADAVAEAQRLVALATAAGLSARLLGGVAIRVRCPSAANPPFARTYGDLDLIAPRRQSRDLRKVIEDAGYVGDRRLNALHGDRRLYYADPTRDRHIDVFLGEFKMCHTLELEDRLTVNAVTLSLADLLLTKLQIIQLNAKDALDSLALLVDHEVATDKPGEHHDVIDAAYMAGLCAHDWGWYTTVSDNLTKIEQMAGELIPGDLAERATTRITALRSLLDAAPKSIKWNVRAAVGRRLQWYEEPEEIRR